MRLTEKRDGQNVIPLRQDGKLKWALSSAGMGDAPTQFLYGDHANKLAEYESLEEQGKLFKLPCKLGDTTYWISDEDEEGNKVLTVRENNPIVGIAISDDGLYIRVDGDESYQKAGTRWMYLTEEEAEDALSELQR